MSSCWLSLSVSWGYKPASPGLVRKRVNLWGFLCIWNAGQTNGFLNGNHSLLRGPKCILRRLPSLRVWETVMHRKQTKQQEREQPLRSTLPWHAESWGNSPWKRKCRKTFPKFHTIPLKVGDPYLGTFPLSPPAPFPGSFMGFIQGKEVSQSM